MDFDMKIRKFRSYRACTLFLIVGFHVLAPSFVHD